MSSGRVASVTEKQEIVSSSQLLSERLFGECEGGEV